MKLTTKSEYACLALIDLAEHFGKGVRTTAEIAARRHIPRKFLEQILLALRRGGYVNSRKGAEGGYCLNKKPSAISVAEIIRLMDGALAPVESVSQYFYAPTPIEQSGELVALFREIRDFIAKKLESTTLADLTSKQAKGR